MSFENGIEIDDNKLRNMVTRVIALERINIRTKDFKDSEIKEKIKKIIEEELKCN